MMLCGFNAAAVEYIWGQGYDLYAPLRRAAAGQPLRLAVLGGSITQAGEGWIGEALRREYPESAVAVINAGIAGTSSEFATYRLQRDILDNHPDIVFIEFTVNDAARQPEDTLRSVESVVRRLKMTPHPPAIVMIEAAQLERPPEAVPPQRRVGLHYGLLNLDLNTVLKADPRGFSALMNDDVHPNREGHLLYAEAILAALRPFMDRAKESAGAALTEAAFADPAFVGQAHAGTPLPEPLSDRPLLLDGRLAAIPQAGSWKWTASPAGWYERLFLGTVASTRSGEVLEIPFRGTSVGVFHPMTLKSGQFYASVDGAQPVPFNAGLRNGYSFIMVANNLEPGEHILRLVIPHDGAGESGVQLGFLLIGGDSGQPGRLAPQGEWNSARLSQLRTHPLPATQLVWQGPFGDTDQEWTSSGHAVATLRTPFPPDADPASLEGYRRLEGDEAVIDFSKLTGFKDRGVIYARTVMESPRAQRVGLRVMVDYFALLYVNGECVAEIVTPHGTPAAGVWIDLPLQAGRNEVCFKVHSGSAGFMLGVDAPEAERLGLAFCNPLDR